MFSEIDQLYQHIVYCNLGMICIFNFRVPVFKIYRTGFLAKNVFDHSKLALHFNDKINIGLCNFNIIILRKLNIFRTYL
jgi:hypothetical protein